MFVRPFTHLSARLVLIPALTGALLVSACQNNGDGSSGMNKENVGTLLGGIGGAVLGAQFGKGTGRLVGVAAGALAGAYLGNQIGSSLDKADKAEMEKASTKATTAPIGQPISWRNPDSGNSGTVTPTREGTASNGDYCREFQQSVTVGGKTEQAYGTACRQPDGSWKVVNG
ncbi:RT0821/Lpp0805 family surface protein [Ferrovibrio sp.]|uniref:RT0821/Lpp0805 family surface protein n=1 Tax=Ferrovibrio sp. TaxID=1917215 RepID=UPI000CC5146D|nr:RT0821/Lpp0805 family surface protein [Ferrovibrio sp.]PJI43871.1 MAG: hypothetical protein CTR53_02370 [Ferrovibrio sp.]